MKKKGGKKNPKTEVEFDHLGCFPDFNKIPKLTSNLIVDNRVRDQLKITEKEWSYIGAGLEIEKDCTILKFSSK